MLIPRAEAGPSRTKLAKDVVPPSASRQTYERRYAPGSRQGQPKVEDAAPTYSREDPPHVGVKPVISRPARLRRLGTREEDLNTPRPRSTLTVAEDDRPADLPVSFNANLTDPAKSAPTSTKADLPDSFAAPPLLPGLVQGLQEALGPDAQPTPIQALAIKHLLPPPKHEYHQCLLASETGSGKSIAYLLPLVQDLKRTEVEGTARLGPADATRLALNPRALVLAPTHELVRQLAGFAKELVHHAKLRVQCASRANQATRKAPLGASVPAGAEGDEGGEFVVSRESGAGHKVDIFVGTPSKVLELMHGRGWDVEERERKRRGLADIEWVVVDEADVLFDPDFSAQTRRILAEVSAARGRPVPLKFADPRGAPPAPAEHPFHLVLASATIPVYLAAHLAAAHPRMARLASPRLHRLPAALRLEHVPWTSGNRDADVERRLRRVWEADAAAGHPPSRVLVFCNKRARGAILADFLGRKGVKTVALSAASEERLRGSNRHVAPFLRARARDVSADGEDGDASAKEVEEAHEVETEDGLPATTTATAPADVSETPHVLVTTSMLSRGLDFAPDVRHVFIVDPPRNTVDFLHRAGRVARAGLPGKVVVFGKDHGRGRRPHGTSARSPSLEDGGGWEREGG
ncbi:P-loop containing nucleoside triphosphate hydrolase protein [Epithele typhae]|uniref:P-loop containing nucleoside triphosphate hydrolase protein n=1 Tax=Epithele typhae TaxID=378194 RepID=UPI00200888DB|nr:P-loop containing nucleoside triphosphate hydrolase protein [Epithele typhae]KAH9920525.1 P-loop containing nucleoside triphosphate hydrolase protein [Epithele typhae]